MTHSTHVRGPSTPDPQSSPADRSLRPRPGFTIGIDYGTNSVRAIVVACADGRMVGTSVFNYPSGEQGVLVHPGDVHLARQNPADYLQGLRESVTGALADAGRDPGFACDRVIGIGADTTGSTPLPLDGLARPLALDPRFRDNLAAHAWLWKDHTGAEEAAAITDAARAHAPELLAPIGGTYSSEWWWSKIWKCLKVAPEVFDAAATWVELADFVPAVLAGVNDPKQIVRCICAAGHKAMYVGDQGAGIGEQGLPAVALADEGLPAVALAKAGLPSKAFLARLDPKLAELRDRLYDKALPPGTPAGTLCPEWASELGLPEGIVIAMGGFDAHYGAIGSGIAPGTLVKIIGTSTCDCAIAPIGNPKGLPPQEAGEGLPPQDAGEGLPPQKAGVGATLQGCPTTIPGICGIVNGSIMPGYYGIEAGQSAVGDLLKWWVEGVCQGGEALHAELSRDAAQSEAGQSGLLALDWNNGNRTVLVDPRLTGLILGQTLRTTRAEIYRALIEATAFGARTIIDRLREHGVAIERVVCCGGIAEKNDLFMQIYADVIGQPMLIAGSPQAPALGAALSAAVTAGASRGGYDDWTEAQAHMTSVSERRFLPNAAAHAVYNELYAIYRELHDAFGGVRPDANMGPIMKRLLEIRNA